MLLLRYFFFAGMMLLGCFWALDAINGPSASKAQQDNMASLQAWRAAEARKEASKDGRDTSSAVIFPSVATLQPTAERLAYESQIASNKIPAPVLTAESARKLSDARAELTEPASHLDAVAIQAKPKVKRKPVASKAVVATAQPRNSNSNSEFALFGRIFEN